MPSASIDLTQFAGIVSAPGLLARNEASFLEATNWEFPAPGVMRKRRGQARQPGNTGGPVWKLLTSRLLANQVLAHVGTGASGTQLRVGDGSVALTTLTVVDGGNITRASDVRMQGAVSQRNHYVTATEGVCRVESGLTDVAYAGMPRGQGLSVFGARAFTLSATGAFANGFARAYRMTWHKLDADGVELGGAPTGRWVIANRAYVTGGGVGQAFITFRVDIPHEWGTLGTALTTGYYRRLWGTRTYDEANGQLGDDEMFLISEAYLTASDIAAGYMQVVDNTPDAFLLSSPRLHTNLYNFPPSEAGLRQGVVNADEPPPVANDVAYWQDCMWYADVAWRPRMSVACISALADGDTLTFSTDAGNLTLTARNVPALATEFQIAAGGPTTAINIRETVSFMLSTLNERADALNYGITGHATATGGTLPGLFFIESSRPLSGGMTLSPSAPTKFQFFDGTYAGGDAPTGELKNGLVFSKPLRADAVPPINVLTAGPADSRVLRILPFRDRLLVFSDYGIYQVTGRTFADFAVNPFDLGYRLLGRDLIAMCDEKVYAWCYEGIIEIDDGGVRVISQPIEPTIEQALVTLAGSPQAAYTTVATLGYATAYRNQHQVRFHYPIAVDANVNGCAQWFAFDTRTRAWAVGALQKELSDTNIDNRSCAVVRFGDDLICYGNWSNGGDTRLFLERRAYAASDYQDDDNEGGSAAITSQAVLQYQVPNASGAQHWQQTVINWDADEVSWRSLPTSIYVQHSTESEALSTTVAVARAITRVEAAVRRGQRMRIVLAHSLTEYAGVVGISQTYRPGSRFARGVTP